MGRSDELPVGFQFAPSDKVLILDYLQKRRACSSSSSSSTTTSTTLLSEADGLFVDLNIYEYNPWDLPRDRFKYPEKVHREMYFFTETQGTGKHCARTAGCGVWHGNGKDNRIEDVDCITGRPVVIGHSTSFKFEKFVDDNVQDHPAKRKRGSSSRGSKRVIKTDWLMHEYRLPSTSNDEKASLVLCKIYKKKTKRSELEGGEEEEEEEERIRSGQQQQALKKRRIAETMSESSSLAAAVGESLSLVTHAEEQKEATLTAEHHTLLERMLVEQPEPQEQQGSMITLARDCEEGRNGVDGTIHRSSNDTANVVSDRPADYLSDGDCGFELEDILLEDWGFDPFDFLAGLEGHQVL